ncbi:DUF3311 domain-containing protein [Komagataeibacter sp. FNDCF1]|uniref:DUF3311 domain-containing protein n=1 Tax=Komagataeibacter sp. FNDCF1 TaxID=2878681 RepID=UPI001E46A0E0|nr:DUF3311 domain-containing protein [Komagataeibacter sp. FNDCF1]MCE2563257.1 DUF3311 domain-containing protein [Komagataeibacter sp. FNDCF1]
MIPGRDRKTTLNRVARMLLAPLPMLMIMGGGVLANRYEPVVLGMPFFMFWIILSVIMCSVSAGLIYLLDPANRDTGGDAAP